MKNRAIGFVVFCIVLLMLVGSLHQATQANHSIKTTSLDGFCVTDTNYMPAILARAFESEDNDSINEADLIRPGTTLIGYHDDTDDFFTFETETAGQITVDLHPADQAQGVQLLLFHEKLGNEGRVGFRPEPPYHIEHNGAAGTYFILVYTESGHSSALRYELQVSSTSKPPKVVFTPIPTCAAPQVSSKYNFEEGAMGWQERQEEHSRAVVDVFRTAERSYEEQYSLALKMNLVANDPDDQLRKGEAYVDMTSSPPESGEDAPMDLTNREITARFWAPRGAQGDLNNSNGVQLFVKDEDYLSHYGEWQNIAEERWMELTLIVGLVAPDNGEIQPGFDPSRIVEIGIKVTGGEGSTATYDGLVFLDAVKW